MFLGILFVVAVTYPVLRWLYRHEQLNNPDPPELAEIKREILIWQKTKASIHPATEAEDIVVNSLESKIGQLQGLIREQGYGTSQTWAEKVKELEANSKIRNKELLWDCVVVLSVVIVMFFVHSIPEVNLDLGWIAILGTVA